MHKQTKIWLLTTAILTASSAFANDALLTQARQVASMVPPKLLQVLTEEIAKGINVSDFISNPNSNDLEKAEKNENYCLKSNKKSQTNYSSYKQQTSSERLT